jgi:hypothetical protein
VYEEAVNLLKQYRSFESFLDSPQKAVVIPAYLMGSPKLRRVYPVL